MKHVTTYQKTKPVYEAYRRAKNKDAYRAKQESSLILHEAAVKTLKAEGVTKPPQPCRHAGRIRETTSDKKKSFTLIMAS